MERYIYRLPVITFLAALSFAGCKSLERTQPALAPAPVPVSGKAAVPGKKAAPAAAAALNNTVPLFIIERNKNANVVHYDANLTGDGNLNPAQPVIAYWVLLAEDGRRKKLNWLEKMKAYGIKVKPDPSGNGYTLTLATASWLPLAVKKTGGTVRAEMAINGRPAVLEKMFIQAKDRLFGPKVEYIELYGKDLRTGEACREKILPK